MIDVSLVSRRTAEGKNGRPADTTDNRRRTPLNRTTTEKEVGLRNRVFPVPVTLLLSLEALLRVPEPGLMLKLQLFFIDSSQFCLCSSEFQESEESFEGNLIFYGLPAPLCISFFLWGTARISEPLIFVPQSFPLCAPCHYHPALLDSVITFETLWDS